MLQLRECSRARGIQWIMTQTQSTAWSFHDAINAVANDARSNVRGAGKARCLKRGCDSSEQGHICLSKSQLHAQTCGGAVRVPMSIRVLSSRLLHSLRCALKALRTITADNHTARLVHPPQPCMLKRSQKLVAVLCFVLTTHLTPLPVKKMPAKACAPQRASTDLGSGPRAT